MDALRAENVVKVYRGGGGRRVRALDGVSLSVRRGTIFGLIGPNGAGKTTLVKCLLDLVEPTAGTCSVLGLSSRRPESRRGVGYLPENPLLPAYLTPREGLAFAADLAGSPADGRGAAADALLARVGLSDAAGRKMNGFSKGMRQRFGLAAALVGSPDILILDEPTDGVDPVGRVEIREILQEEKRRGATIFLNSHLLAETEKVCDDVAILSSGKVARTGTMAEVTGSAATTVVELVATRAEAVPPAFVAVAGTPGAYRLASRDLNAINAALDEARRRGFLIASVAPEKSDLEEALMVALGERK